MNKVVGLSYEPGQGLPKVVLKGSGALADKILQERSPWSGPPVVKDARLAEQLYRLPIDAEIGPDLFLMVATLLAHVFSIEEKLSEKSE